MPGTVQGLKESLLRAIDSSGNVLDMALLVQVVTDLEVTPITAEDLTITRLGLYINNARRKTTDKTLARRMKDLLKDWKLLVQSSQSNGIPRDPTPQPVSPTATLPSDTADSTGGGVVTKPNNALTHRKVLLGKLSAIKKPQATPTALQSLSETPKTATVDSVGLSLSEQAPASSASTAPPLSEAPVAVSNGKPGSVSLTVRLPLERLSQQQQREALVVSIPLALVRLGGASSGRGVGKHLSSGLDPQNSTPTIEISASPPLPALSVPSLPTATVHATVDATITAAHSLNDSPGPLVVSIPRMFLTVPLLSKPTDSFLSSSPPLPSLLSQPQVHLSQDLTDRQALPDQPTGRLKGAPDGCLPGTDGCYGLDGSWYSWTEIIPNLEPTVTILPYVYIDGIDIL